MSDSQEVRLLRAIIRSSEPLFVTLEAGESDTDLYNRNTTSGIKATATVDAGSLQTFDVGNGKIKLLFKVEES